jgi:LuxR family transcriptional regulator, activator of conjugal transfer of Ti plasmids
VDSLSPLFDKALHRFAGQLVAAKGREDLRQVMARLAESFDLHSFAYLVRTDTKTILISTYAAEWTAHYLRRHYESVDPVIVQAARRQEPFSWGCDLDGERFSAIQRRLFDEAAQFGIRYGFTIPLSGGQQHAAALTFAADDRDGSAFLARSERLLEILRVAAICFHAHVRNRHEAAGRLATLTPRERECLHWAMEGKSAGEIGGILGVSRRTVAFHLDNAKAKLGVWTVAHAVALFARLI